MSDKPGHFMMVMKNFLSKNNILFYIVFFAQLLPAKKSYEHFHNPFVEIRTVDPTIRVSMPYATRHNFTKKKLYKSEHAFVLPEVAQALKRVQNRLRRMGVGLLIWDAYRPMSVQQALWDTLPDPKYISPPSMGGRHTRGTTVDVTLIDIKTGKQLDMPTGFDDFSEKAHRNAQNVTTTQRKNRQLLQDAMYAEGFTGLPSEWWHFDYKDYKTYMPHYESFEELLDISQRCRGCKVCKPKIPLVKRILHNTFGYNNELLVISEVKSKNFKRAIPGPIVLLH